MAQIRERWNIPKLADMNPSSLPEWPITEQTKIFALLGDPQAEIGVTLGENFFMYPTETSSRLAFETDRDYKNCMVCTRARCVGRRAPYNAELAKELRG